MKGVFKRIQRNSTFSRRNENKYSSTKKNSLKTVLNSEPLRIWCKWPILKSFLKVLGGSEILSPLESGVNIRFCLVLSDGGSGILSPLESGVWFCSV